MPYGKTFKQFRQDIRGKEIDPHNAAAGMKEDDGPHFTKLKDSDTPNFTTVAHPEEVINMPHSKGNTENKTVTGKRAMGKPGKSLQTVDESSLHEIAVPTSVQKMSVFKKVKDIAKKHQTKIENGKKEVSGKMNTIKHGMKTFGQKIVERGRVIQKEETMAEGSARGGYTKRGAYSASPEIHKKAEDSKERLRGIETKPETDARSYGRTHTGRYNEGPHQSASDRAKAERLRKKNGG